MSGLEIPFAIAAIGGTTVQVGAQISAAGSQREMAERSRALKEEQAKELLSRNAVNERILLERAEEQIKHISGPGGGLWNRVRFKRDVSNAIMDMRRDAEFKARMLRKGADIELELASDLATQSILTGVGGIFTGAGTAYRLYRGPAEAKEL